jgi:hypothetical protein
MRMLMTIEMDNEAVNRSIKDGSLPKMMDSALERLRPEAAYFTTRQGNRTAYVVVDLQEPAQMLEVTAPFFMGLNAKIDWSPVMTRDELREGLTRLAR